MYLPRHVRYDNGLQRMTNAVWMDLVNMVLWFLSAVYMVVLLMTEDKRAWVSSRARYRKGKMRIFL